MDAISGGVNIYKHASRIAVLMINFHVKRISYYSPFARLSHYIDLYFSFIWKSVNDAFLARAHDLVIGAYFGVGVNFNVISQLTIGEPHCVRWKMDQCCCTVKKRLCFFLSYKINTQQRLALEWKKNIFSFDDFFNALWVKWNNFQRQITISKNAHQHVFSGPISIWQKLKLFHFIDLMKSSNNLKCL